MQSEILEAALAPSLLQLDTAVKEDFEAFHPHGAMDSPFEIAGKIGQIISLFHRSGLSIEVPQYTEVFNGVGIVLFVCEFHVLSAGFIERVTQFVSRHADVTDNKTVSHFGEVKDKSEMSFRPSVVGASLSEETLSLLSDEIAVLAVERAS